jgi:transcriptional regulator NrdR family protein
LSMIPWKRVFVKDKRKHTVSAKESKEVLQLLMGHMHTDPEIEELVKKLSENLYEGQSHEIDKKRLGEIVKKLQE